MIISLSPKTEHGCPYLLTLTDPSITIKMKKATGQLIDTFVGNVGRESALPRGVSVLQSALESCPWVFGITLYMPAYSYMAKARDGLSYNLQISNGGRLVFRTIKDADSTWVSFIVVKKNPPRHRFEYSPVIVNSIDR